MINRILPAIAVVLAVTVPAMAAQTTGTVTHVNKAGDSLTLKGGRVFHLPEGIEVGSFKVGEKVHLVYATHNGRAMVSKATAAM